MDTRDITKIRERWPGKKCVVEHPQHGLGEVVDIKMHDATAGTLLVWFDGYDAAIDFETSDLLIYRPEESEAR